MADLTVTPKDSFSAMNGTPPANHTAWLEQLESAQWQQKLRYQPDHGSQARHDEPGQESKKQGNPRGESRIAAADQPALARGAAVIGNHLSSQGRGQLNQLAQSLAPKPGQPLVHAYSSPAQPDGRVGAERDTPLSQLYRPYLKASWQAQHAHAMFSPNGVRLWLRDAQYGAQDGEKLVRALRQHFADLGLRLTQFTLNGKPVSGTGYLESNKEESWQ